ncbi:MAG TPA: cyclic nucleotide-gated ion channel [Rhizomicrobium sp.]|jgi:voltage-gated potassium channel|nr:cyclic nucleotide-gated ion channel [Rhizomicrobium sp.]
MSKGLTYYLERFAFLLDGLTAVALVLAIGGTATSLTPFEQHAIMFVLLGVWALMVAEFLAKLYRAPSQHGYAAYFISAEGLIDILSVLALPLGWLCAHFGPDSDLFALIWILRYIRDDTRLGLFWRVIERSRAPLLSLASVFLIVFIVAATLAYIFERNVQPDAFGSIPKAMWWAIVTLTTTGYGDALPVTIWGRILAGWLMIGGIVMFSLQAGVIATAFAEELRRRHFLHTWDLVMSVSFFQGLGAAAIADIVRLLHSRDVSKNTVIVQAGDPGDAMYFIVSGEAAVQLQPQPIVLGPGSFFGEMALLFGTPRSADVVATKPSVLLVLDIADFRDLAGRRPEIVTTIETEGLRRRAENASLHRNPVR